MKSFSYTVGRDDEDRPSKVGSCQFNSSTGLISFGRDCHMAKNAAGIISKMSDSLSHFSFTGTSAVVLLTAAFHASTHMMGGGDLSDPRTER